MDHSLSASPTAWIIAFLLGLVTVVFKVSQSYLSPSIHYPPGPRPDPLIGNLRQVPFEHQEITFTEWGKKYGDVVYATILGQPLIILNSSRAARDLMEKRGVIYSERPRFVLISELMGWNASVTQMQPGERFRKHRRLIQERFNRDAVLAYRPLQEKESRILLAGLLQTPESFMQHVRRFAAGTITRITYGHTIGSVDDIHVRLAERAGTATVESGSQGSMLVDFVPPLKHIPLWMPGAGFKRNALKVREDVEKMMNVPFDMVKSNMKSGTALPSFTSTLLESHTKDGQIDHHDEEDIKGAAGILYTASADTTAAIISTFVLAMLLHQEVYEKLQRELDRVVGTERLPTFDDRGSLPYLDCVLKEVYRWHPAVPLGIPHRVSEDDSYRGYHIPKGATVIANACAMAQDPGVYPSPHLFRPERFMQRPPAEIDDPRTIVFGFGRRACPGRHFGDASVWIAAANITAAFAVSKALDSQGREITPAIAFKSGIVSHPKPFRCSIRPRSAQSLGLIRSGQD